MKVITQIAGCSFAIRRDNPRRGDERLFAREIVKIFGEDLVQRVKPDYLWWLLLLCFCVVVFLKTRLLNEGVGVVGVRNEAIRHTIRQGSRIAGSGFWRRERCSRERGATRVA